MRRGPISVLNRTNNAAIITIIVRPTTSLVLGFHFGDVFIFSYLLHPLASRLSEASELSWRGAVNLIFLIFIIAISLLSTATGFAVVDQFQSLIRVVQNFVSDLPQTLQNLSTQIYIVGPLEFDFSELETFVFQQLGLDFLALGEQAFNAIQPVLGSAGGILGSIASTALTLLARAGFILLISYFILADIGQVPQFFKSIDVLGQNADLKKMGSKLGKIWNAFIRGQLLIFGMIVVTSFILMTILGVRNALGLAFLTGLAKFVPYVGPLVAGVTTALVAFFQGGNYLNIEPPFTYALVVVVAAIVLDQIFDTIVSPRIHGQTLGVHPAAVLVAALVAANLLGLVGLLVAAPILASFQLFGTYAIRKMLDLDPWPEDKGPAKKTIKMSWPLGGRITQRIMKLFKRGKVNDKRKS